MAKKKYIDLEEMNIILRIPKEAVGLTLKAQLVGKDGKLMKVVRKLSVTDIHTARTDFLENVPDGDDYDAMFMLTDEGKASLDEIVKGLIAE
ncbi:MAG: hypothetical protein J6A79_16770 [Clostridia bacterium]|nr:hypothetical protein [Clostridia bacterium]